MFGPPSPTRAYVFNGDLVDRGTQSSEVLFFVLGLLTTFPDRVFINRGNHEDLFLNTAYGFHSELSHKYGPHVARTIEDALARLYTSLPLCTWHDASKTFISHAGPPLLADKGGATVSDISHIHRRLHLSTTVKKQLQLPHTALSIESATLLENMLWSDPDVSTVGMRSSAARGAGLIYGLDVVDLWMRQNKIRHFVRSHQCVQFGYERCVHDSDERVLWTVFSSADYRGSGNEGAVMLLSQTEMKPIKFQTDEIEHVQVTGADPHCYQQYSHDVIRGIFRSLDKDGSGELTKAQVRRGLSLAKSFTSYADLEHCVVGNRSSTLNDLDFDALFASMDVDQSGTVCLSEFTDAFMKI